MKRLNILIFILMTHLVGAQQLPQLTQYMMNSYAINPAIAGMQENYHIRTTIRNQWVGIQDAPTTNILSIYGRTRENIGLGGIIFNDQAGPTSKIGANFSYTYHLKLSAKIKVGLSLAAGFSQFKIDKLGWNLQDIDDPIAQGDMIVDFLPDATFGFNFYADNWYFGGAVPQLISGNLDLIDPDFARNYNEETSGSLNPHFYLLGAYNYEINQFWQVDPNLLIKYVNPSQTQFDFGLKTLYDDRFWVGVNYRSNGDVATLFGYNIGERFNIGYSYDIVNADINDYSSSSHEFMIGINFVPLEEKELLY